MQTNPENNENPRYIEGYRLLKKIGTGGMSAVYEAISPDGTHTALKLLHPSIIHNQSARQRLRREVAMMQRIKSAHIAQILDAELDGENLFIVTELINGQTLETDVREEGRYTEEDLYRLGKKLAKALQEIHHAGVLHRDLKPSNVMIRDGEPVLIDFGISQADTDTRLTQTGFLTHTPGFCDPRILLGALPDETADWWAMTAVLAYAATGTFPFGNGAPVAIVNRVLNEKPDLPRLTPDLQKLFTLALDPDLNRRISYKELLAGIKDPIYAAKINAEKTKPKEQDHIPTLYTDAFNTTTPTATPSCATQNGNLTIPCETNTNNTLYPSYPPQNSEKHNTTDLNIHDSINNIQSTQQPFTLPTACLPNPTHSLPDFTQHNETGNPSETTLAPTLPVTRNTAEPENKTFTQPGFENASTQKIQTRRNPISPNLNPHYPSSEETNRNPYCHLKPLKHYPIITLLLALILTGIGTAKPLPGYMLLLASGAVLGTIGALYTKLTAHRIRRGHTGSQDFGIILIHLPLALLSGIWRSLFSGLIGALTTLISLFTIGYKIHGLNRLPDLSYTNLQASIQTYFTQLQNAGSQFLASLPIFAFLIGLSVYWFFPTSATIRTGLKVVLREIIPSPLYHVFWIILLSAISAFAVFAGFS